MNQSHHAMSAVAGWLTGCLAGVCNTVLCIHIGKVLHLMDVIIVHGRILYAKRKNDLLFGRYKSI